MFLFVVIAVSTSCVCRIMRVMSSLRSHCYWRLVRVPKVLAWSELYTRIRSSQFFDLLKEIVAVL